MIIYSNFYDNLDLTDLNKIVLLFNMLMSLTNRDVYLGNQYKDIWAINIKKMLKNISL